MTPFSEHSPPRIVCIIQSFSLNLNIIYFQQSGFFVLWSSCILVILKRSPLHKTHYRGDIFTWHSANTGRNPGDRPHRLCPRIRNSQVFTHLYRSPSRSFPRYIYVNAIPFTFLGCHVCSQPSQHCTYRGLFDCTSCFCVVKRALNPQSRYMWWQSLVAPQRTSLL